MGNLHPVYLSCLFQGLELGLDDWRGRGTRSSSPLAELNPEVDSNHTQPKYMEQLHGEVPWFESTVGTSLPRYRDRMQRMARHLARHGATWRHAIHAWLRNAHLL
jgi:hypothetical protein